MSDLFTLHMRSGLCWVSHHANARCQGFSFYLGMAFHDVSNALAAANAMRDRQRQATCLRILSWMRAAMRAGAAQ